MLDAAEASTAQLPVLQTPLAATRKLETRPLEHVPPFQWTVRVANTFLCATPAVVPVSVARALSAPARLARSKMTGGAAQWPADQLPRPPEVCPEPEDSFKLQLALSETKVQSIREQLAGNSRKDAEAAELARRDSANMLETRFSEQSKSFELQVALLETNLQSIREQLAENNVQPINVEPLDAATGCGHGSRPATTALEPPKLETRLSEQLAAGSPPAGGELVAEHSLEHTGQTVACHVPLQSMSMSVPGQMTMS